MKRLNPLMLCHLRNNRDYICNGSIEWLNYNEIPVVQIVVFGQRSIRLDRFGYISI